MIEREKLDKFSLKQYLHQIRPDDFTLHLDEDVTSIIQAMLTHMGDTDSVLRDDLILSAFFSWIMRGDVKIDQIRHILFTALDRDHLFRGIGTVGDDVFMRAFAIEVVAACIEKHLQEPYLSATEADTIIVQVIAYYNAEIDLRGYVDGKGWAHSAAHGADALNACMRLPELQAAETLEILESLKKKATTGKLGYAYDEDERMAIVARTGIETGKISIGVFSDWLKNFSDLQSMETLPDNAIAFSNGKHFLRALYFMLMKHDTHAEFADIAVGVLKDMDIYDAEPDL